MSITCCWRRGASRGSRTRASRTAVRRDDPLGQVGGHGLQDALDRGVGDRRRGARSPLENRSGNENAGHSRTWPQPRARHSRSSRSARAPPRSYALIQFTTRAVARFEALTITSISPPTPVSRSSVARLRSEARFWGTSLVTSVCTLRLRVEPPADDRRGRRRRPARARGGAWPAPRRPRAHARASRLSRTISRAPASAAPSPAPAPALGGPASDARCARACSDDGRRAGRQRAQRGRRRCRGRAAPRSP